MLRYFTKLFIVIGGVAISWSQDSGETLERDLRDTREQYGIRLGVDLSRPLRSFLNEDYTGLELIGDLRITQKLYLAAELGNEDFTQTEELGNDLEAPVAEIYNYTTSGSYIKLGVEYNTYENWYGMNNTIFIGGRYAFSTFSQTLNENGIFDSNRYWFPDGLSPGSTAPQEYSGLNASWLEFLFGVKAELFANIYLGASVRLGYLISNKEADNFPNLWIPGFNKVTDGSNFGVGFNYSISYFLPIIKKRKKPSDPDE
ncbi:DUF6048 family protein [Lentiprolixibacter aurantiacus]|uniref:DUF6048 family protein n=1 Tax=Lentiprolixibacter aurantiacus TaxID=2993939 RepID=A0AAE3MM07_9FLAO|nr:DUF6048 family protein [Lentiprolixibacter aurantiacus]MCX2719347.1 DUF6048 family protein [Lentiprolixibacter aurantiacus]